MKFIKGFFFFLVALFVAGAIGVVVCSLNPELTEKLAQMVQTINTNVETDEIAVSGDDASGTPLPELEEKPGVRKEAAPDEKSRYVVPSGTPTEEVNGRSGYEPVSEETEEISGDEAEGLSNVLSKGSLGEEFSFSSVYYPYYDMLEESMKLLYKQIYANANDLTTAFAPNVTVSASELKSVFEAVTGDHPELFWVETGYSCKYLKNGNVVEITLQYNDTANDLETAQASFSAAAQEIVLGASGLSSDFDKAKYVHDALIERVTYEESADMNQSAYSALVNGESVCAGYARAYQYVMQQLSIPTYYCTGYSGENHAWDIVKFDTIYRNVDVTWDDTDPATTNYFYKTDADFASTHVRTGLSVYLPACVEGADQTVNSNETVEETPKTPEPTPMRWVDRGKVTDEGNPGDKNDSNGNGDAAASTPTPKRPADVGDEELMTTLSEYYADCQNQMETMGAGYLEFSNVVTAELWNIIEHAYSDGTYVSGYVEPALKTLHAGNFSIQLYVQSLGGGYYRIYHSIYTESLQ